MKKDPFRHCEKGEELLGLKVPYLSVIGALMYLANCTHPDITLEGFSWVTSYALGSQKQKNPNKNPS